MGKLTSIGVRGFSRHKVHNRKVYGQRQTIYMQHSPNQINALAASTTKLMRFVEFGHPIQISRI